MEKTKVLFVSQLIEPYTEDGHMANVARHLPQRIQERGKEIRTFMSRFGCINERRYQLHEVIRLSGMNLIINDSESAVCCTAVYAGKTRLIDNIILYN